MFRFSPGPRGDHREGIFREFHGDLDFMHSSTTASLPMYEFPRVYLTRPENQILRPELSLYKGDRGTGQYSNKCHARKCIQTRMGYKRGELNRHAERPRVFLSSISNVLLKALLGIQY